MYKLVTFLMWFQLLLINYQYLLLFIDIGKLKEMTVKKQKFKATISMADKHPLSLRDQVLPIVKLLVSTLSV